MSGRNTVQRAGNQILIIPVKSKTVICEGVMVAIKDGYAIPATKEAGLIIAGCNAVHVNNFTDTDGAFTAEVKRGIFKYENSGNIKDTDILKNCYVTNEETVTITATGSSLAGKIIAVDDDGVSVEIQ